MAEKRPGVWHLRWVVLDPSGQRHWREETIRCNKRQAQERANKVEYEINNLERVNQNSFTLEEWLDYWLANVVHQRRPKTLQHYMEQLRYIKEYAVAKVQIKSLTPRLLLEFLNALRQRKTKYGRTLSSRAVDHVYAVLRNALQHAENMEELARNPMHRVPRQTVTPVRESRALTEAEFAAYVVAADKDRQAGPMIHLAMDTGMRREDLAGLKWAAVDLDNRVVEVREVLTNTKHAGLVFHAPKTKAGRRTISISQKTEQALRSWKTAQQERQQRLGDAYQDHDLVFPSPDGTPGTPEMIYHRFKRFQKRHQLPASELRLHELRHTAATMMLVAGHGAGQVAKRLGHSSARVTQSIYEHLHQGEQTAMGGLYDRLTGYCQQEDERVASLSSSPTSTQRAAMGQGGTE